MLFANKLTSKGRAHKFRLLWLKHAQRQKEYIQKRKQNYPDFNKNEAERRKNKRRALKLSPAKYENAKAKYRAG